MEFLNFINSCNTQVALHLFVLLWKLYHEQQDELHKQRYKERNTYNASAAKPYMERSHLEDQAVDLRIVFSVNLEEINVRAE
jgi:hypothetical protein